MRRDAGREMTTRIVSGRDENGRIYAEVYRMGHLWKRFTSNGVRPFETTAEATVYARKQWQKTR